jgi:uncharacterized protein (TIGR00251 family)
MTEIIEVKVKPNSKKFEVLGLNEFNVLEIKTKAKAIKGKANKEIEKKLKKLFKAETKIVQGLKSKNKKIEVKKPRKEIIELINKL